jgi:hypothetical protein
MNPKINPLPQEPASALHPKQGLRIRITTPSSIFAKRSRSRCPAAGRGQSTARLQNTACRRSVIIIRTMITAGRRIITGDRRLTIAGRRRRYPCLITCFSSPERVLIFGSAGLNRWRGQAIGRPTIGMTRIAMTRVIPSTTRVTQNMTRVVQCPSFLIARNSRT